MKNTMRWQLTSSALHTFMGALSTSYGYAKDLNESLTSIQIVTQKSNESMAAFAENANKAAKALSTTTTDYTDASLIYYQQGLDDDEVLGRTNTTIKLANVAGETAQAASEQLTAIWNNFYDGSKSLEYYADVMTALGASTASSTQEISAGLQKFAAVAETVGLSYEYAASALATITATTRESADVVGTSLRTLFARIQGLLQDEDQDDGTTLNKYSKALAQVGIDIKDTSGELKSMNDILDEMGAKWGTLSQAQQMALAQTVAGVRQYTQLIALMENWEFFQENLVTAMGAEGTLEEQAEVYANSWEAARKRVKASAEDIYDSLYNADFFVDFDNGLASLLSGVADSVDALGGMKGVINLVGIAFTQAFGDKLAQNLRDLAYNFTVMTGKAEQAQMAFKETAGSIALSMVTDSARSTDAGIRTAMIQAEDIEMQNLLNKYARQLSEEQMVQLSNYKDMITQIKTIATEQERVAAEQAQWTAETESTLLTQEGIIDKTQTVRGLYNQISNDLKGLKIPDLTLEGKGLKSSLRDLDGLVQAFKTLQTTSGSLTAIKRQFEGLEPSISKDSAVVKQLNDEFKRLTGIDLSNSSTTEAIKQIDAALQGVSSAAEKVRESLVNTRGVTEENANAMSQAAQQAGEAAQNQAHSTAIANEEAKKYLLSVIEATQSTKDWASTIVSAGNYMMRLGMMIQGIKNLGSIWSNDDLTTGEKVIQTLTSGGMILQTLIPLITMATKAKAKYTMASVAQTGEEAKELLASKLKTNQKIIETKVIDGNTVAVIANTTAWYANPMTWIVAGVTAVIAAFTIYNSVLEQNTKRRRENAQAEAEAAVESSKAIAKEREASNSLYREYIDLRSQVDTSTEAKESLKKKTDELCEALGIEWDALDRLNDKYDEVNKEIAKTNRDLAKNAIEDAKKSIKALQNSMLENGSTYDSYLANQEGYESLSYKVTFDAGFSGGDEQEISNYLYDILKDTDFSDFVYKSGTVNQDFSFYVETAEQFIQAYELLSQAYKDIQSDDTFDGLRQDSEIFDSLGDWIKDYKDDYESILQLQKDMVSYSQQLAEAEGTLLGYDLASVKTLDEYNEVKSQYISELREIFEENDLIPADVEDVEKYFEDLAGAYLAGFDTLAGLEDKSRYINSILERVGEENRETVQKFIENDDYDIEALAKIDWDVVDKQGKPLEEAIEEAYQTAKDKIDAEEFSIELPVVVDVIDNLQSGKDLTEDQIKVLEKLEDEYGKLGAIQDRTSAQYIQALRDIREGMEHVTAVDKINELNDAWDKLWMTVQSGEHTIEGVYKVLKDFENESITVKIDGDDSNLAEVMGEILDADYAVQVAIEADLQSDMNDITSFAKAVESATSLIQEGFLVAYDDAQALQAVFPGILAQHTITANGMIQLNSDIAQSCVELAHTQITNDKEACKQNILDYQAVLLSKAAAMRQIAEGLAELAKTDGETSEQTAEAKAKIEEGLTNFKAACADEQALISEGLATSEISDENQVLEANENAAGTSANNWADAYDSMAKNSADWAKIAIGNANAVAKAMKAAQEGGDPSAALAEVSTGGIFSSYGGGFEAKEYSNTYESRGEAPLDWSDYYEAGDYQAAYEAAIKQAEGYELAAAELTGWIASIDGATAAVGNLVNTVGRDPNGTSKTDKKNKTYDAEDKKTLDEVLDRYHEITREIERQQDILDDISNEVDRAYGVNKIRAYKKELQNLEKQQANYQEKLNQANDWLKIDAAAMQERFGNQLILDETTGEILNYTSILTAKWQEYSAFVDAYNAERAVWSSWTKEEQDANAALIAQKEEEFKKKEESLQLDIKTIEQYEKTLDVQREMVDNLQETARAIADNKLSQVEYRLEVVIDVKSMKDAVRDLEKNIQEIFNDALTHGIKVADIGRDQANADVAMIPEYVDQFARLKELYESADNDMDRQRIIEDIQSLQGNVIDTAEALVEWWDSIEDIIPDILDAAAERYKLFTDQLEHNTTVLDTIKELYTLQGVTYKTMDGFNKLQKVSQEKLEAQVAEARIERGRYDELKVRLAQAQAELDALNGDETDPTYDTRKKARDAYLEQFNEAEEAYLSLAKDAMETAQQMYMDQLEKAVYDFGQIVSNGVGLDLLQDKYDHYIEKDERYFDKVNEAYQTTAWFNKLQEDIDKTTNAKTKERLKDLQEEINMRREGNKLSQYDLDILNAKYEVLKAQMALEDAQNAKDQMMLTRDSQGNWNYQFYADQDKVAGAEKDLLDAENEWYNIAKQQVTDVTGEIISTWQECQEKIKEIYSDMTLTDQERADRAAEIYDYYTEKIKYLEEEKQVAIADMTEAGNASLFTAAVIMGDELTDLTGITSEDIKNIVEAGGDDVIGLLTADNETIKNIIASNTDLIDLFDNVYATDLDNMTSTSVKFEDNLRDTLEKAQTDFQNYRDTVLGVAEEVGVTEEDLVEKTDEVSNSTDELTWRAEDAAIAIWGMVDAAQDAVNGYLDMADAIWEAVAALQALAAEQASYVESQADLDNDDWTGPGITPETPVTPTGGGGNTPTTPTIPQPVNTGNGTPYDDATLAKGIATSIWIDPNSDWKDSSGWKNRVTNAFGKGIADQVYSILAKQGYSGQIWSETYVGPGNQVSAYKDNGGASFLRRNLLGYDTGGYTGEFADGKLAILHEKELVLNKEDTRNILDAVDMVRQIAMVEKALDGSAIAAMALMGDRLASAQIQPTPSQLDQTIHIDNIEFPNVTSSDEIKEAFKTIANDAAQWARRRKE